MDYSRSISQFSTKMSPFFISWMMIKAPAQWPIYNYSTTGTRININLSDFGGTFFTGSNVFFSEELFFYLFVHI